MPKYEIRLFGGFEVSENGVSITRKFRTQKTRALLAYLLLRIGRENARAALAGLFWPESTTERAAHSLRQALSFLRRVFAEGSPLRTTRQIATWDHSDAFWLDAQAFESAIHINSEQNRLSAADAKRISAATDLYRGELLAGFFLDDSAEFEIWLVTAREQFRSKVIEAFERLADFYTTRGEYERVERYLTRVLALDPFHEAACRGLMRTHALNGAPGSALACYEKFREGLFVELGIEPLEATRALYNQIKTTPASFSPTRIDIQTDHPFAPFAGRAEEHAQLVNTLDSRRARQKSPAFILIEGEAGLGKTRLVEEFGRFALSQNAVMLTGRCFEFGEMVAYQPVVEALREALDSVLTGAFETLPKIWLAELSRLLPEIRGTISNLPALQPGAGQAARQRLFDAVLQFLLTIASPKTPLILFLDDLHWADESSLDLLHYLIRRGAQAPILFLGTYRPEETGGSHPLTKLRRGLSRDRMVQSLSLEPLSSDTLQTIAHSLTGEAGSFGAYLDKESEGNPFVLAELLNTLYESGKLQHGEVGRWQITENSLAPNLIVSTSLRDTILRRVDRLPDGARRPLQTASVIGRSFAHSLISKAAGVDASHTLDIWIEHRLVRPVAGRAGQAWYDFAHDKIREVVYHEIPLPKRQTLHGKVADSLLEINAGQPENAAAAIAHHLYNSPEPGRALPHLQLAAEQAANMLAFAHVADYCTQALSLELADTRKKFAFLNLRQRAYQQLGRTEAEGSDAKEMAALAENTGAASQKAVALERLALYHARLGEMPEARAAIQEAVKAAKDSGESSLEIKALVPMSMLIRDMENGLQQALDLLEYGLEQTQKSGDQKGQAFVLGHLGIIREERGEFFQALAHFEKSLVLLRAANDITNIATCLYSMAGAYRTLGQLAKAETALTEALQIAEELDLKGIQLPITLGVGRLELYREQPARAREAFERALMMAVEFQRTAMAGQAHLGLGQAYLLEGDYRNAREALSRAVEIFDPGDPRLLVSARAALALALDGLKRTDQAQGQIQLAVSLLESGEGSFLEPQHVYWAAYQISGNPEFLASGYRNVMMQAEVLTGKWRAAFLENVPVNRDVLEMWEVQG